MVHGVCPQAEPQVRDQQAGIVRGEFEPLAVRQLRLGVVAALAFVLGRVGQAQPAVEHGVGPPLGESRAGRAPYVLEGARREEDGAARGVVVVLFLHLHLLHLSCHVSHRVAERANTVRSAVRPVNAVQVTIQQVRRQASSS
ncbi:hypothetical protein [Streptomyces sp. NPDC086023]|uniref:hypothetical protein n=1 Tax=Streptomyces sp. NPDC086023 TaxID=3365746 RepID=UPI0037D40F6C